MFLKILKALLQMTMHKSTKIRFFLVDCFDCTVQQQQARSQQSKQAAQVKDFSGDFYMGYKFFLLHRKNFPNDFDSEYYLLC